MDWKDVWKDALGAATGKLKSSGKDAQEFLKESADAHKKSVESLVKAFADGQIDKETFESELADEKRVLRTELLALQVITKKGAQDAANAFFNVIEGAVAAGIDGLL